MATEADLLGEFEEHSPDGIRAVLAAGVSPTEPINGKRPIDALIEMYLRSSRFPECLQVMLDAGAEVGDRCSKRSCSTTTKNSENSFPSQVKICNEN